MKTSGNRIAPLLVAFLSLSLLGAECSSLCLGPYSYDCFPSEIDRIRYDLDVLYENSLLRQGASEEPLPDLGFVVVESNTDASLTESALAYRPLVGDVALPATEVLLGTAAVFADNLAAGAMMGQAHTNGRPFC